MHGSDDATDTATECSAVAAAAAARATEAADAVGDERISCDFFDTRHGFLRMCQGNNYQFDTLRRAKHSSMMILWHLHNPNIPAYAHTCNACESDIGCGVRWHCEACVDYDICEACYEVNTHPHPLVACRDTNVNVVVDVPTGGAGSAAAGGGVSASTSSSTSASPVPTTASSARASAAGSSGRSLRSHA